MAIELSLYLILLFNEHLTIQNDPPSQHTLYHIPHVLPVHTYQH